MIASPVKSWSITQCGAMISLVWAEPRPELRKRRVALVDDMLGGSLPGPAWSCLASPSLLIS